MIFLKLYKIYQLYVKNSKKWHFKQVFNYIMQTCMSLLAYRASFGYNICIEDFAVL